ncbi:protein MpGH17.8 [Marchantia polymorpha subsp. ruderalis]|uniref:Glucan endo-1,3-beta-D-glucosidase n=1 Tax=Marchantia polymorpha TaxID=3197 RepID=A0A2R6XB00_MARPO|nr:hypothetical protein MARPO_0026s0144 [Marchantia polymorpha]BBN02037.1 hypothetical protein Mp_2g12260 [Marchantia polymorpha subsp. ruderalis]|eukprot:PTQ43283.1 hypothetical protein MARPO_0026s0144 [Marchantia polymorpha]
MAVFCQIQVLLQHLTLLHLRSRWPRKMDCGLRLSFDDSLIDRGSNLIAQKVDAVHAALEKVGFPKRRVTIGQIGWPSAGDGIDATVT